MAKFELAIPIVLKEEGGYVDDPHDHGGRTRYGISQKAYPNLDIKNLTVDDAKAIYQRDYWQYDGIQDQAIANKVFSLAVLCYPRTANRLLQLATTACGHVVVCDGRLGPITLNAVNAIPPDELLTTLKQEAVEHFQRIVAQNPEDDRFLDGWINRVRE